MPSLKIKYDFRTKSLNEKLRILIKWIFDQVKNFLVIVAIETLSTKAHNTFLNITIVFLKSSFCYNILSYCMDCATEYMEQIKSTKLKLVITLILITPTYWVLDDLLDKTATEFIGVLTSVQLGLSLQK